jgi:hypothetical protein
LIAALPKVPGLNNLNLNVSVFEKLTELTNYVDTDLHKCLAQGFPLSGEIKSGGIFQPDPQYKPVGLWRTPKVSASSIDKVVCSMERKAQSPEILKEVHKNLSSYSLEVSLDDVLARPEGSVMVSPTFGLAKTDIHGNLVKVRPICNYSWGHPALNELTDQSFKITLPRLIHFAKAISLMCKNAEEAGQMLGHKVDHSAAFTQVPITESASYLATVAVLTEKGYQLRRPLSSPFGATASVANYIRTSNGVVHYSRCLFLDPRFGFYDDFFSSQKPPVAQRSLTCFITLNDWLGLAINHDKTIFPCTSMELLGILVSFSNLGLMVKLTQDRKAEILSLLKSILLKQELSSKDLGDRFYLNGLF